MSPRTESGSCHGDREADGRSEVVQVDVARAHAQVGQELEDRGSERFERRLRQRFRGAEAGQIGRDHVRDVSQCRDDTSERVRGARGTRQQEESGEGRIARADARSTVPRERRRCIASASPSTGCSGNRSRPSSIHLQGSQSGRWDRTGGKPWRPGTSTQKLAARTVLAVVVGRCNRCRRCRSTRSPRGSHFARDTPCSWSSSSSQ